MRTTGSDTSVLSGVGAPLRGPVSPVAPHIDKILVRAACSIVVRKAH